MAVVPICCKISYSGQPQPIQNVMIQSKRGYTCVNISILDGPRCFSSVSNDMCRKWHSLCLKTDVLSKTRGNASKGIFHHGGSLQLKNMTEITALLRRSDAEYHPRSLSRDDTQNMIWYASDSSNNKEQLRLLDSYFGKLQEGSNLLPSDSSNKTEELLSRSNQFSSKKGLEALDAYLNKLDEDANSEKYASSFVEPASSTFDEHIVKGSPAAKPLFKSEDSEKGDERKMKSYMNHRSRSGYRGSSSFQRLQQYDETSDLYLISILISINIAVFLFELASPVRISDLQLFSLPLLYGAKINDLILVGEWWRLVTPMFLHSGIFHMAVGCWALLTFGPKVCKNYGSFTFVLIYILGGISGNLTSFLHTPEPTVGGTGPIYAIIGAWLVYQIQNKDVIGKDVSDSMLQKAMITTAISSILSHFGQIDEWTHFGAALTGIAYAYFTCPTLQLGDASSSSSSSSRTGQEDGLALVKRSVDPCKSLFLFGIFILLLSSLLFFVEPPR